MIDLFECLLDLPVPVTLPLEKAALAVADLRRAADRVHPTPTEAQKESGNYRKGHVVWKGLPLTIETAKGQYRSGTAKDGTAWRTQMKRAHYGYIKKTESEADGDHIDIFLADGDGGAHLDSELVFVVNQRTPGGGFDEHKCVLGCVSEEAARETYLAAYSPGWTGLGSIVPLTLAQFKRWVEDGDTGRELKDPAGAAVGPKKSASEAASPGERPNAGVTGEDCPHCGASMERGDDGRCNRCGKDWPAKEADAYHFTGDVQGVHLRKTLHKILDKYHAGGLAYNDAKTNDVYATINADATTRDKVMADFQAAMAANPRVKQYAVEPAAKKEKLRQVALKDKDLQQMFDREGFTSYLGWEHDPAAYRRHWVAARYRLNEDPKTHVLSGDVPDLAYRQLHGLEPVYGSQVEHPEQFGLQHWMHGHIPPPPANPPAELEVPRPDLGEKSASPGQLPRILWVKRAADDKDDRPYTIAVDLDGTLAEAEEPFDPKTIGPVRAKAREWVREFKDAGARIIIFTVRGDVKLVAAWLKENDVPYDFVNENPDQPPGSSGKVIADCYWDDRAHNAKDPDEFGPAILSAVDGKGEKKKPTMMIEKTTIRVLLAPDEILENLLDDAD